MKILKKENSQPITFFWVYCPTVYEYDWGEEMWYTTKGKFEGEDKFDVPYKLYVDFDILMEYYYR